MTEFRLVKGNSHAVKFYILDISLSFIIFIILYHFANRSGILSCHLNDSKVSMVDIKAVFYSGTLYQRDHIQTFPDHGSIPAITIIPGSLI